MIQIIGQVLLFSLILAIAYWIYKKGKLLLNSGFREKRNQYSKIYDEFEKKKDFNLLTTQAVEKNISYNFNEIKFENNELFNSKYENSWREYFEIVKTSTKYDLESKLNKTLKNNNNHNKTKYLIDEIDNISYDYNNNSTYKNYNGIIALMSKKRFAKYLLDNNIDLENKEYFIEIIECINKRIKHELSYANQVEYSMQDDLIKELYKLSKQKESNSMSNNQIESSVEKLKLKYLKKISIEKIDNAIKLLK